MDTKYLDLIKEKLETLVNQNNAEEDYYVPSIWLQERGYNKKVKVEPARFFITQIEKIISLSKKRSKIMPPKWSNNSIIYNLFVRYTTAYDHNCDGIIDINRNSYFKEIGTFLKSIAMLPYLHSIGVNTIYLLPITSIGKDRRKGQLGSPYAVRNPLKIDEMLSEDILGLDIGVQFKGFVEAVHLLNMKVVLEFVFRTASVDCELALQHPEWFYWIRADLENRPNGSKDETKYGPPFYSNSQLEKIRIKIASNDFSNLPEPSDLYKNMFCKIPEKVDIVDGRIVGTTLLGEKCIIPGAFADWPPDDSQPIWSDVTYLRLYHHPKFNYIAYNTVRMYDSMLANRENAVEALWDSITNIIPYYQKEFNIDGVMIDMGHALPEELRRKLLIKAKRINPNFVFWEENFSLNSKSLEDGYDAVVGYLPFDEHNPYKMKELLKMLAKRETQIPFFATPETHNTPRAAMRAGGVNFSKFCWAINCFIPALPFILSGFELGEKQPINTGLGFTLEDLKCYPQDKLPLFSLASLNWESDEEWTELLLKIIKLRNLLLPLEDNFKYGNFINFEIENESIIAFARKTKSTKKLIIFIGNLNSDDEINFTIKFPFNAKKLICFVSNRFFIVKNNELELKLKPMEFLLGELICLRN